MTALGASGLAPSGGLFGGVDSIEFTGDEEIDGVAGDAIEGIGEVATDEGDDGGRSKEKHVVGTDEDSTGLERYGAEHGAVIVGHCEFDAATARLLQRALKLCGSLG